MNEKFINWLIALAPEGETALFIKQRIKPNGKPTYVAHLPERYLRSPDGAWYGNTGSFKLERLAAGVRVTRENIDYVLLLMLDDIGTKSKTPPIEPTWKMETSPGNQQWCYVFRAEDAPTKQLFTAAVAAIAAAGFTDEGATNCVRNFRLPGSVNLKPERNGFESRLVEWHPAREFTLEQIMAALGVPMPDPTALIDPVLVDDGESDEVMQWLSAEGLLLERPNAAGWAGVVCPNAEQHSNDDIEGRYFPASRAYKCLHGHCVDWNSERFLRWVEEQGGPAQGYGLREELVAERMRAVRAALTPTEAFPDQAAQTIAEVERREAGRVEKEGWYERFAYLHSDDGYFDLVARKQYSRSNFDAVFRHVLCLSIHAAPGSKSRRRIEASRSFDENRQDMGARVLQGVTYAPGEGVLVSRAGDVYANLWRDARPAGAAGDATPWLRHVERMVPDTAEREHALDWMAFKVQRSNIKINHGILHGGFPGSGKDTMWEPFLYAVGGASKENIATVKNEELNSQWGYSLMSEVLVINELRQTEVSDRRALENRLKPLLAAPPELLSVNRKGLHPFDAQNRLSVVAFSNERMAITLTSDDRRWFVLWSDAGKMDAAEAERLWQWYDKGGRDAVAAWLRARDVSGFLPGAAPVMTEAKAIMLQAGLSPVESALVELIKGRHGEFAAGAVQAPWQALCDRLAGLMPNGSRVSVYALFHALSEAGWLDCGRVKTPEHQTKTHVMCAPEIWEHFAGNRSEIRRLCERGRAGGPLRVVG